MSLILSLLQTGVLIYAFIYFVKNLIRWVKLRIDLSWVPGPPTLPIIGNANDLIRLKTTDIPKLMTKWFSLYGTTIKYWIGMDPVLVVQDPDMMQALSNTGKHAQKSIEYKYLSAFCGESLLTSSGDVWYRKRKLTTPCFHYEILETFLEEVNKIVKKFVTHLTSYEQIGEKFNFFDRAKLCALDILMETSMGSNINALENENNPYVHAITIMRDMVMMRSMSILLRNDFIYKLSNKKAEEDMAANVLKSYVREVIKSKRDESNKKGAQDVIQNQTKKKTFLLEMLLDLNDEGSQIDDTELEDEVNTFIFAGHDTVSVCISYTVYLMGKHPEIQEKVYQELTEKVPGFMFDGVDLSQNDLNKLEFTDRCIKESLRMFPPVPLIGKVLTEPLKTEKGTIPPGINITQVVYALHHNENLYPNNDVYDPDRFLQENVCKRHPYAFIPFGAGARNCIGQKFALNEVKTLLVYLIKNFIITSTSTVEELGIGFDIVLTPTKGIHISIKKRT